MAQGPSKKAVLLAGIPALAAVVVLSLGVGALVRGYRVKVPPGPANESEALAAWARVLEARVDGRGRVDFEGLSRDREDIEAYLCWVAAADASGMDEDGRLAFHINAYNALAMYGGVRAGILEDFGNIFKQARFFVVPRHEVAGARIFLYDFENKVIRREGGARIHAVLNCMVRGCPRLPREPFRGDVLDEQLDREARRFYNEERNVHVDCAGRVVRVSEILGFYTGDFLAEAPSLLAYVNRYRDEEVPEGYEVEFIPYDWTVNGQ